MQSEVGLPVSSCALADCNQNCIGLATGGGHGPRYQLAVLYGQFLQSLIFEGLMIVINGLFVCVCVSRDHGQVRQGPRGQGPGVWGTIHCH